MKKEFLEATVRVSPQFPVWVLKLSLGPNGHLSCDLELIAPLPVWVALADSVLS